MGEMELRIVNFGLTAAYRVTERIWAGAGLSIYEFDFDAVTRRYRATVNGNNPHALFDEISFEDDNEVDRHLQEGSDQDVRVNLGMLVRGKAGKWACGVVYRQPPKFDFDYRFEWKRTSVCCHSY